MKTTIIRDSIVINRMYAGDYLSSNLGHEVINMFASDTGEHYLYFNPYGNIPENQAGRIKYMLLTQLLRAGVMEVLGYATISEDIYHAKKKDAAKNKQDQDYLIRTTTYCGVTLEDIFRGSKPQDVFITFKANSLMKPKERIVISCCDYQTDAKKIQLEGYKLGNEPLRQYFHPEGTFQGDQRNSPDIEKCKLDFQKMVEVIEDASLWEPYSSVVNESDLKGHNRSVSLFDICMLQNSELAFSNAFYYFLQRPEYKPLWCEFLNKRLGCSLSDSYSVTREEQAKITDEKSKWSNKDSGGRMDLFIRDGKTFVIIENKIKSDINSIESDRLSESKINQLVRYWNYAHWLAEEHETQDGNVFASVLRPNYSHVEINNPDHPEVKYEDITYNDIYSFLSGNREAFAQDLNFVSFYEAMKRHTFETISEYMKHEMEEKFYSRIIEMRNEQR